MKEEYNLADFGAAGDGSDESAVFQRALNELPDGGTLIIPANQTYRIGKTVTVRGKSFDIEGSRSTQIIQLSNQPVFDFYGSWGAIYSISSIETVDYRIPNDFSPSTTDLPTSVSKLVLNEVPVNIQRYDTIRVVSEDQIPDNMDGRRRKGEYAVVAAVSGNVIYLAHTLRETYLTSPKLAKLNDVSFGLRGITFFTEAPIPSGYAQPILRMTAGKDCRFTDLRVENGHGTFLELRSIYGYLVDGMVASGLRNVNEAGHLGYAIHDAASEFGVVSRCFFYKTRHGYTTNGISSTRTDDLAHYGYAANSLVTECISHGSTNSGFDTHPESYNITFVNCKSIGSHTGSTASGGAGFQIRGNRVELLHCTSERDKIGIQVMSNNAGTRQIRIKHSSIIDSKGNAIIIDGRNGMSDVQIIDSEITGGSNSLIYIQSSNASNLANEPWIADVTIKRTLFKQTAVSGHVGAIQLKNKIRIHLEDISYDARECTANNRFLVSSGDNRISSNRLRIMESEASTDDGYSLTRHAFVTTGSGDILEAKEITSGRYLRSPIAGFTNSKADYTSSQTNHVPSSSNEFFVDVSQNNQQINEVAKSLGDVIYVRLRAIGGSYDIGAFPLANRNGQILIVKSTGSGNHMLNLRPGREVNRSQPSTIVLSDEQTAVYAYASGFWLLLGTSFTLSSQGPSYRRPNIADIGFNYFDTTLGKPVWLKKQAEITVSGAVITPAVWVDAMGTIV